jgi:adenine-specific DNA-methyltransferase
VSNIVWRKKTGGGQTSSYFATEHEYILSFRKNKIFSLNYEEKEILEKDYPLTINNRKAKLLKLEMWGTSPYKEDRPSLFYSIKDPKGNDFYPKAPDGRDGRWRKKPEKLKKEYIFWKESNHKLTPYEVIYYDEDLTLNKTIQPRTIWYDLVENTQATKDIINLFGSRDAFSYSKPEKLLQRIIEMSTEKGDIVLDYHLGSGTTAAVAHKMGRQYIGIEQMDYVETIAVERLKKVIEGEQGGISKAVNWQGGGDFIYFELAKWNEVAKERILEAESLEQLIEFFDEMYERYFLNYNLKIQEFRDKIIQEESFQNLPLAEQKQIFIAMLDNNQMYVNKSEMSDAKFGISEEEQALTEEFYNSQK